MGTEPVPIARRRRGVPDAAAPPPPPSFGALVDAGALVLAVSVARIELRGTPGPRATALLGAAVAYLASLTDESPSQVVAVLGALVDVVGDGGWPARTALAHAIEDGRVALASRTGP